MDIIKKIGLRIVVLIILMIGFNWVYIKFFFEKDLQVHSDLINLVRNIPINSDIVFFGESSNFSYRTDDKDKRAISEFIIDYYPKKKLGTISKGALHAGNYKLLMQLIPKESKVKTIIVTLNLRSFDANWIYSKLETSLQKSMVLLKKYPPLLNRFILSFKGYDIKSEKEREFQFKDKWANDTLRLPYLFPHRNVVEWDYYMAHSGIIDATDNIDEKNTILACHYIKTYAFQIDTLTNPRIKDFNEIVDIAKKRGWNLVFNLMSENIQKTQKLVGSDLVYLMDQNRKLLINYYKRKGVTVVDNLRTVPDEEFIDQDWTTEHYAEKGRKSVAQNVAISMKKFYPNDYSENQNNTPLKASFFNDCEKNEPWGQMQTLTNEKAFSGSKSSKTGAGQDYSITFEKSLRDIPSTSHNKVMFEFQMYQTSTNHDAKFIIEVKGMCKNILWQSISITDFTKEINSWKKISYSFDFPEKAKYEGEIIKAYLYNQSKQIIYLDDFKVNFQ